MVAGPIHVQCRRDDWIAMKKLLPLLAFLLTATGIDPAVAQVAVLPLPADAVVQRGLYRYADQQWIPEAPMPLNNAVVVFDNTTGTGGYLPLNQVANVDPPAEVLDWGTLPFASEIRMIEVGYATTSADSIAMTVVLRAGTGDGSDGETRCEYHMPNLPASPDGTTPTPHVLRFDISGTPCLLPEGPFGIGAVIHDAETGLLTAIGGTGITDAYRIAGEIANRVIDGFFAQFHWLLDGVQRNAWYVDNAAPAGGDGSQAGPFNALPEVELVSGPGDVVYLQGGLRMMKG